MESILKKFTAILDPEDDGGYSVYCPALPGRVVSQRAKVADRTGEKVGPVVGVRAAGGVAV